MDTTTHFLGFYRPIPEGKSIPDGMTLFTPGFRYLNALVLYRDNAGELSRNGIRKIEVPLLSKIFEGKGMHPFYQAMQEMQEAVDELRPVDPYYSRKRDIFVTVAPAKASQPIFYSWDEVSGISAEKRSIKDIIEASCAAKKQVLKPSTKMVICDHAGRMEYCKVCPHGKPHLPEIDAPFGEKATRCDTFGKHCAGDDGYMDEYCMCVPVQEKPKPSP